MRCAVLERGRNGADMLAMGQWCEGCDSGVDYPHAAACAQPVRGLFGLTRCGAPHMRTMREGFHTGPLREVRSFAAKNRRGIMPHCNGQQTMAKARGPWT